MAQDADRAMFPALTAAELNLIRPLARAVEYADGDPVFRAGDTELDLCAIESGAIEIQNPADGGAVIVTHHPGGFTGDIDILTGRPAVVTGVARGPTRVLRVPNTKLRVLLNRAPSFGEKLVVAFTSRREALARTGKIGHTVIGSAYCKDTHLVREFLYRNFVPFTWVDTDHPAGRAALAAHPPGRPTPVVLCNGKVLFNPSLRELAECAGIWRHCPEDAVDLAIVGAGPAGIAAAVYAASEGLSTVLVDQLGPGGQAAASSKIENFVGFPAGLSGTDLATRGVLQMLKFGAKMAAPVLVERVESVAGVHRLHLDCGAVIPARVVLAATGVRWRKLPAAGADRFEGAGVHYVCTAVEAVLYDQRDVVVVGGGNSAGQAVMHLAECCPTRRVHLVVRSPLGSGMSEYLVNRIRSAANVTVHEGAEVTQVDGGRQIESVTLSKKDGPPARLACTALFVFIGADPAAGWLPTGVARDKLGYLLTGADAVRTGRWPLPDRDPCPLETTVPGILAAGDVRAGSTKRVGFAVGDGSLAVTCVHRLLTIGKG